MIKIRGEKDYLVALESVAMTDIVLNMFIFFFISFSLIYTFSPMKVSKIDINLPKAATAVSAEGAGKVVLTVTEEGKLYLDDEEKDAKGLRDGIKAKIKDDPALGVILKVDGRARFEAVATTLDIINELDIRKVSIAVLKEK